MAEWKAQAVSSHGKLWPLIRNECKSVTLLTVRVAFVVLLTFQLLWWSVILWLTTCHYSRWQHLSDGSCFLIWWLYKITGLTTWHSYSSGFVTLNSVSLSLLLLPVTEVTTIIVLIILSLYGGSAAQKKRREKKSLSNSLFFIHSLHFCAYYITCTA